MLLTKFRKKLSDSQPSHRRHLVGESSSHTTNGGFAISSPSSNDQFGVVLVAIVLVVVLVRLFSSIKHSDAATSCRVGQLEDLNDHN